MYKITLSPDTKVKIQAFGFDDDALPVLNRFDHRLWKMQDVEIALQGYEMRVDHLRVR